MESVEPGSKVEIAVVDVLEEEADLVKILFKKQNSGERKLDGKGRVSLNQFADPGDTVTVAALDVQENSCKSLSGNSRFWPCHKEIQVPGFCIRD